METFYNIFSYFSTAISAYSKTQLISLIILLLLNRSVKKFYYQYRLPKNPYHGGAHTNNLKSVNKDVLKFISSLLLTEKYTKIGGMKNYIAFKMKMLKLFEGQKNINNNVIQLVNDKLFIKKNKFVRNTRKTGGSYESNTSIFGCVIPEWGYNLYKNGKQCI